MKKLPIAKMYADGLFLLPNKEDTKYEITCDSKIVGYILFEKGIPFYDTSLTELDIKPWDIPNITIEKFLRFVHSCVLVIKSAMI